MLRQGILCTLAFVATVMVDSAIHRRRNLESHLFGEESKPERYDPNPDAVQNHQAQVINRRRALNSNIFELDSTSTGNAPATDANRRRNMMSNLQFGNLPPPNPIAQRTAPLAVDYQIRDIEFRPRRQSQNTTELPPVERRVPLPTPHRATFLDAQVKRPVLPSCDKLVQPSPVPPLAPFPEFHFELPTVPTSFDFPARPLTTQADRNVKRFQAPPAVEMRKIREEIARDSAEFETRMRQIQKVELIQPVRPVTAVKDDPPTLEFSFERSRRSTQPGSTYLENM
jgi:hypothetical protein